MTKSRFRPALRQIAAACVLALGLSGGASAVVGALDDVPAATLLLPYFEVDLANPNGQQTRFTLTNAQEQQVLAHVTLWTDLGMPTYSFDVYLGGRDSVEVDLRLAFEGVLPRTGPGLHAPGPHSDAQSALCQPVAASSFHPGFPVEPIAEDSLAHLRTAHTGQRSPLAGNLCMGARKGDQVARGYVTIDTANTCGSRYPSEPGYFIQGGIGFASNRNALTGTYTVSERLLRNAALSPLVHIEADATNPASSGVGVYTYYAKMVAGTGIDNREPLPTVWQARQLDVPQLDTGTEVVVWRDAPLRAPYNCSAIPPSPFPLNQTGIAAVDEQEEVDFLNDENHYPNPQPPPVLPFPYAAQRAPMDVMSPFAAGYVHLNLGTAGGPPGPMPGTDLMQAHVSTRVRMNGVYGAAQPGTAILFPFEQGTGSTSCTGGPYVCSYRQALIGF